MVHGCLVREQIPLPAYAYNAIRRKFATDTLQINWQDFVKKTIKQSIVDEIY